MTTITDGLTAIKNEITLPFLMYDDDSDDKYNKITRCVTVIFTH